MIKILLFAGLAEQAGTQANICRINAYRKSLYAGDTWGYANEIQKNRTAEMPSGFHPPLTGGMMATVSPEDTEVFSFT